jgi:hypothetical protein
LQGRKVCLALLRARHDKSRKFASMALIHASASSGSSALVNVGAFIPINWVYEVTIYGPSWLAPCGGLCSSCCTRWSICCCICRSWRNTSVCAVRSASVSVRGGGGGGWPLPEAPKPLGVLRVGPTIWKFEFSLNTHS